MTSDLVEEPVARLQPQKLVGDEAEERVAHRGAFEGRQLQRRADYQVDVLNSSIQTLQKSDVLLDAKKTFFSNFIFVIELFFLFCGSRFILGIDSPNFDSARKKPLNKKAEKKSSDKFIPEANFNEDKRSW